MILKLLVLMTALAGMVSASGAGHRAMGSDEPDADGHGHGYGHDEDDPDAGWRGFGKVVSGFTIVATVVVVVILVMMFLSLAGVWEDDLADSPV